MPQIPYRANLSAANYPMTIADGGRTVIVPGLDQNFDRRVDPSGEQKDAGIPQALYLENVMPTPYGYQSVGYWAPAVAMTVPSGAYIVQCIEIRASFLETIPSTQTYGVQNLPLFIWSDGSFTTGRAGINTVTFIGDAPDFPLVAQYSIATVGDKCYLYAGWFGNNKDLYEVTTTTGGNVTLENVSGDVLPANFLVDEDIVSICGTNNYLVCHNNTTAYWSSLLTPTDFTSSLVTGAGQINPNNANDSIAYIKETSGGFYAYAANDIIYAQYTGNARYPFKFAPVIDATGLHAMKRWQIYGQSDSLGHYIIGKNKIIQLLQDNRATPLAPEVADFMSKTLVQELLNSTTNIFTSTTVETKVPSIYVYLNRYIIISVNGTNDTGLAAENYTHALVFDTQLRRYGKLKIDHSFLFSYWVPNEVLGFVNKQNNTIRYLNFDIYGVQTVPFSGLTAQPHEGALLLGKFQYVRSRVMQMEEIEIEGPQNTAITPSPNFSLVLLPSTDGRNFDTPIPLTPTTVSGGLATYHTHQTARNHSLLLKGAFSVNTVQLKFVPGGER